MVDLAADEKVYYGTKRIVAWPETRDGVPGYGVRYSDSYKSWSPKDIFEAAYCDTTNMSFGHAHQALLDGEKIANRAWLTKYRYSRYIYLSTDHTLVGAKTVIKVNTVDGDHLIWMPDLYDLTQNEWYIIH